MKYKTEYDLYQTCVKNHFISNTDNKWSLQHLHTLLEQLNPEETIHCAFVGLWKYQSVLHQYNNYMCAMTNQRFIMVQKALFHIKIKSIPKKDIHAITMNSSGVSGKGIRSGKIIGVITIESNKKKISLGVESSNVSTIYQELNQSL